MTLTAPLVSPATTVMGLLLSHHEAWDLRRRGVMYSMALRCYYNGLDQNGRLASPSRRRDPEAENQRYCVRDSSGRLYSLEPDCDGSYLPGSHQFRNWRNAAKLAKAIGGTVDIYSGQDRFFDKNGKPIPLHFLR